MTFTGTHKICSKKLRGCRALQFFIVTLCQCEAFDKLMKSFPTVTLWQYLLRIVIHVRRSIVSVLLCLSPPP